MSTTARSQVAAREVPAEQYLNRDGLLFLWNKMKATFMENGGVPWGANFYYHTASATPAANQTITIPRRQFIFNPVPSSLCWGFIKHQARLWIAAVSVGAENEGNNTFQAGIMSLWPVEAGSEAADSIAWDDITGKPELVLQSVYAAFISETQAAIADRPTTQQMNQAISGAVGSVYRFAGSVATYGSLPTENLSGGDVYNTEDTGMNYAWVAPQGEAAGYWDALGGSFAIEAIPNTAIQSIVDGTYGQEE